jgi:hypothetical protein
VIKFMRLRDKISQNLETATEDEAFNLSQRKKQRVIGIREAQNKAKRQLMVLKAIESVQQQ